MIEYKETETPTATSRYVLRKDITNEVRGLEYPLKAGTEFMCMPVGPRLRFLPKEIDPDYGYQEPVFTAEEISNKEWFLLIPEYYQSAAPADTEVIEKWYKENGLLACDSFTLEVSEHKYLHYGLNWKYHRTRPGSQPHSTQVLSGNGEWVELISIGRKLPGDCINILDIWHFIEEKGYKIPAHFRRVEKNP